MTGVTSRLNCSVVDWVVSVAFPVGRSGNTIVVSHNINGGVDNYRSIYVHLRDGATHDCALSWSVSLARYPGETDFRDFITKLLATQGIDPGKRWLPRWFASQLCSVSCCRSAL